MTTSNNNGRNGRDSKEQLSKLPHDGRKNQSSHHVLGGNVDVAKDAISHGTQSVTNMNSPGMKGGHSR